MNSEIKAELKLYRQEITPLSDADLEALELQHIEAAEHLNGDEYHREYGRFMICSQEMCRRTAKVNGQRWRNRWDVER